MKICQSCGGVLGRDCFNEQECLSIGYREQKYKEDNADRKICELQQTVSRLMDILANNGIDLSSMQKTGTDVINKKESEGVYPDDVYPDDLPF